MQLCIVDMISSWMHIDARICIHWQESRDSLAYQQLLERLTPRHL